MTGRGNKATSKRGPYINFVDKKGEKVGHYINEVEWQFVSSKPFVQDSVLNYIEESDDDDEEDALETHAVLIPSKEWNQP